MAHVWQSDRVAAISSSATVSMGDRVKQMRAAGQAIIPLSTGTPDFDTPSYIKEAGISALRQDRTYVTYSQAAGLPELREALAAKLKRDNGISLSADDILITVGVKEGIFIAAQACFNPGDEILIPSPTWVSYDACLRLAGAAVKFVPCSAESGFRLDVKAMRSQVSPKTRAILITTPCNPTGTVLPRDVIEDIAALAIEKDLLVFSDEIYEYLSYGDAQHVSIGSLPGMAERTLTFNGFSKAYAMTGWRVGYVAGPKSILRNLLKIHGHAVFCTCTFSQKAAAIATTGPQEERLNLIRTLSERRDELVKGLNSIPGIRCATPDGSLFCFPDVSGLGMGDSECAEFFLDKAKVATLPGSAFGPGGEGHLRVMFARRDPTDIHKAIEQMREAVKQL